MEYRRRMSREVKAEHWQKHINDWKDSGLSQKQFCQGRSLALSTFCYWKRKTKNPKVSGPRFYPLTIPAVPASPPSTCLRLLLGPKEFKIEIQADFSPTMLKKLIATLESL